MYRWTTQTTTFCRDKDDTVDFFLMHVLSWHGARIGDSNMATRGVFYFYSRVHHLPSPTSFEKWNAPLKGRKVRCWKAETTARKELMAYFSCLRFGKRVRVIFFFFIQWNYFYCWSIVGSNIIQQHGEFGRVKIIWTICFFFLSLLLLFFFVFFSVHDLRVTSSSL